MNEKIGPWKRSDIRSLDQLCKDALRLSEAPARSLIDSLVPSNQFKNASAAQTALELHPIYRWLRRELPTVLKAAPGDQIGSEFRLVMLLLLLRYMSIAMASQENGRNSKARMDKRRTGAWDAIGRVEAFIVDNTITLADDKIEMLGSLLAEAKTELMRPIPKAAKVPALQGLAYALYRQLNIADAQLLLSIATCLRVKCGANIQLDKRTAERYVAKARKD